MSDRSTGRITYEGLPLVVVGPSSRQLDTWGGRRELSDVPSGRKPKCLVGKKVTRIVSSYLVVKKKEIGPFPWVSPSCMFGL